MGISDIEFFKQMCESTHHAQVRKNFEKNVRQYVSARPGVLETLATDDGKLTSQGRAIITSLAAQSITEVSPQVTSEQRTWLEELCLAFITGLGPIELAMKISPSFVDIIAESSRPLRVRVSDEDGYAELPISYLDDVDLVNAGSRVCAPNGWRWDGQCPVLQREWNGWTIEAVMPSELFSGPVRSPWVRVRKEAR